MIIISSDLYSSHEAASLPHHIPRLATTHWLDLHALSRWILSSGLLDDLYGDSMHAQLTNRADEILKCLARTGMLQEEHLQLLWKASG